MLKCYTLANSCVTEGIEVAKYESIVASSDTEVVTTACIHLIPVIGTLSTADPEDFAKVASGSLAFICAENSDENISNSGVLLSIDPYEWALTFDKSHAVLLDPSGVDGNVLVYVKAGTKYHIQNRRKSKTLFVDDDCNLSIRTTNRASLMMQALNLPALKINPPANTHQSSQASSKKRSSNRRSNRQEK